MHIVVDTGSVSAAYEDVAVTLKTADWLDAAAFPQAVFDAARFAEAAAEKTYTAGGTLKLRDKTVPVTVSFTLEEYSDTKAKAKGYALIKRNDFGVGQGAWAKTDEIKDDVKVEFVLGVVK